MESIIPTGIAVEQWRRQRSAPARLPRRPVACDHLHETTTRYDPVEKLLTFLLTCPVCRTERVLETQHYEPRFRQTAA